MNTVNILYNMMYICVVCIYDMNKQKYVSIIALLTVLYEY